MISETQVGLLEEFLDRDRRWESADDVLRLARFILHDQLKVLESALTVLDRKERVQCFDAIATAHNGARSDLGAGDKDVVARSYWSVPDSRTGHANPYTCTEVGCTCMSYCDLARAADGGLTPMCKHLLAVRLATALGLVECVRKDEAAFAADLSTAMVVGLGLHVGSVQSAGGASGTFGGTSHGYH